MKKEISHLTLDDRISIQQCLDARATFKHAASRIGKDPTTVSKEVRRHITKEASTLPQCPELLKAPFVCNGCRRKSGNCGYAKQFYRSNLAHKAYKAELTSAREGLALDRIEFWKMDDIVKEKVKEGQHLYQIVTNNEVHYSMSSIYRLRKEGKLSITAVDLPRTAKFKPRKAKYMEYIPKKLKIGRTYNDFKEFIEKNNISRWVEMDTLIGRIGGKVIVTLHFTSCNFMVGLLADNKGAAQVTEKIMQLKHELTKTGRTFGEVFPVLLTDNGGEFSNITAIENSVTGEKECSMFFCDPYCSSQKARIEKNHTHFRDIVASGTSFDRFTQETVSKIFSHVNSVNRLFLNGKTPYESFAFFYGEQLATTLGIERIPGNEVIQSSKLIAKISHTLTN